MNRYISHQEIPGLQAVLGVIRAVATHDEVARIAICEHPTWAPLNVLLGLVGCSVVISLKTELLLTLAALGKSKETALQLWVNLEFSQIIHTVPTTNTFGEQHFLFHFLHFIVLFLLLGSRNIETEIDQLECRNETYPLTQALLEFLYSLVTTAVPHNLGAGPRRAGLDPYVGFIIDAIFLKFYNRLDCSLP